MKKKKTQKEIREIPKVGDTIRCLRNCDNYTGNAIVLRVHQDGYIDYIQKITDGGNWFCSMRREDYEFNETAIKESKFLLSYFVGGNQRIVAFSSKEIMMKRIRKLIELMGKKQDKKLEMDSFTYYKVGEAAKIKVETEIKISEE